MIDEILKKMEGKELLSDIELDEVLKEMLAAGDRDLKKFSGRVWDIHLNRKESEMISIWNKSWNNVNNASVLHKKIMCHFLTTESYKQKSK